MTLPWVILWRGYTRLYFNSVQAAPFIWSLDDGNIEHEVTVRDVQRYVGGFTTQQRTPDMPAQPRVWIEVLDCVVYMNRDTKECKLLQR
jgi:hypothetical protein